MTCNGDTRFAKGRRQCEIAGEGPGHLSIEERFGLLVVREACQRPPSCPGHVPETDEDRAILDELDVICNVLANLTHPVRVFLRVHAQVRPIDVR
jgi:hypothetical protein